MLVPLFGVQLLLTIYRPDVGDAGETQYEYVTLAVSNSQVGFIGSVHQRRLNVHRFVTQYCFSDRYKIANRAIYNVGYFSDKSLSILALN